MDLHKDIYIFCVHNSEIQLYTRLSPKMPPRTLRPINNRLMMELSLIFLDNFYCFLFFE